MPQEVNQTVRTRSLWRTARRVAGIPLLLFWTANLFFLAIAFSLSGSADTPKENAIEFLDAAIIIGGAVYGLCLAMFAKPQRLFAALLLALMALYLIVYYFPYMEDLFKDEQKVDVFAIQLFYMGIPLLDILMPPREKRATK